MGELIVRCAEHVDLPGLATLIDGFAKGHPAEHRERSSDAMRDAFLGTHAVAYALVAERNSTLIGFIAWRRTYDMFWSFYGGEAIGLYVIPSHRGSGVALCLIAAMCADIRKKGGQFLQASYGS